MRISPTIAMLAALTGTAASAGTLQTAAPTAMPMTQATPTAMATPDAPALTDKEQKTLNRCKAMTYGQVQQSSKCTKLMKQAGVAMTAPEQPRQ